MTDRPMNLILDCDGVLLDWEADFRHWVSRKLRRPILANAPCWDLSKWLRVSPDEAMSLVHEFNHSLHFGRLLPMVGAVEVVRAFKDAGFYLHVVTSCSRHERVVERRRGNLEKHFGNIFRSVTCLDLGESKAAALVRLAPGIWVEDNYHGALTGHKLGHETHMLRWPHNREWEAESVGEIEWHDDWASLGQKVTLNLKSKSDSLQARGGLKC